MEREANYPFKNNPEQEPNVSPFIRRLPDHPDKIIRHHEAHMGDVKNYGREVEKFRKTKKFFDDIRLKGVRVPELQLVIGEGKFGDDQEDMKKYAKVRETIYVIVDRIYGSNLEKLESIPAEELDAAYVEFDQTFVKWLEVLFDAYLNNQDGLIDMKPSNIMFGHKKDESDNHLYYVDTEPHSVYKFTDKKDFDHFVKKYMDTIRYIENHFFQRKMLTNSRSKVQELLNYKNQI